MTTDLRRIAVVGPSASGKTTVARDLAARLGLPHVELDALHWLPGWRERPDEEFRHAVGLAVDADRWIVDGNYPAVQDLVLDRATAVIWLDFPFRVVFARAMRRTLTRIRSGEEVCNGNREGVRAAFFHPDGIPYWVVRSFRRVRRRYERILLADEAGRRRTLRITDPGQVTTLTRKLQDVAASTPR
jgi:hypothetical protein